MAKDTEKHPGRNSDEYVQVTIRVHPDIAKMWDNACRRTGHTRNSLFAYVAQAFDTGRIMIGDPTTWEKYEQHRTNQILRTVRDVVRKEVHLVLFEMGFTSSPYRK